MSVLRCAPLLAMSLIAALMWSSSASAADSCTNADIREQQGSAYLPDCRAWELVSPGDNGAYHAYPAIAQPDGNAMYWYSGGIGSPALDPSGEDGARTDIFMQRRSSGGWLTNVLTEEIGPLGNVSPFFQVGLSVDGAAFFTDYNLVPEDTNETDLIMGPFVDDLYKVVNGEATLLSAPSEGPAAPEGVLREGGAVFEPLTVNPDLSASVFMTTGAFLDDNDNAVDVYLRRDNELHLISRNSDCTPNNSVVDAFIAAPYYDPLHSDPVASAQTTPLQVGDHASKQGASAISENGDAVAFITAASLDPADDDSHVDLYLWRDGEVILVSGKTLDGPSAEVAAIFEGMSADGSVVYFSTTEALTPDDPQSNSRDIYRFDADAPPAQRLKLVTGPAPDIVYTVSVSASGELFFATPARLTDDAPEPGPEWIVYRTGGAEPIVVAWVPSGEAAAPTNSSSGPDYNGRLINRPITSMYSATRPIRVSPDGSFAVFTTAAALVPEDSDSAADVYLWRLGNGLELLSGGSQDVPALIAGPKIADETILYGGAGRVMSADGSRVFFTTAEKLTSDAADNGRLKVYEWHESHLTLVSPAGKDAEDARYVDNSTDGSTVFFETSQRLLPADDDGGMMDLYAARIGGGLKEDTDSECLLDACLIDRSSPVFPNVGSASGHGDGNLRPAAGVSHRVKVPRALRVRGPVAKLRVRVSAPGSVVLAGPKVHRQRKSLARKGAVALRVALKPRARKALRSRSKVSAVVRITYRAQTGAKAAKRVKVTFTRAKRTQKRGGGR